MTACFTEVKQGRSTNEEDEEVRLSPTELPRATKGEAMNKKLSQVRPSLTILSWPNKGKSVRKASNQVNIWTLSYEPTESRLTNKAGPGDTEMEILFLAIFVELVQKIVRNITICAEIITYDIHHSFILTNLMNRTFNIICKLQFLWYRNLSMYLSKCC